MVDLTFHNGGVARAGHPGHRQRREHEAHAQRAGGGPNAKAYEVRLCTTPNTWLPAGTYTQARRIVVEGLTPGTIYTFQVRAVGGITGYSGWSDPLSHMAT